MSEIPAKYLKAIHRYQPVEVDGVLLYPVTVDEYEQFNLARPAIEFVHQSLPVAYVSMPLLQAYYAIDIESIASEGETQLPTGLFSRAMLFLALALRIGVGETPENRIRAFKIRVSPNDGRRLMALTFTPDGEEYYDITPVKFQRWLPILAAQNGITLHNDTDNPELLVTEAILSQKNAPDLDLDLESLVSGVAALSGADESSMYDWPILKLQNRQRALKRAMDYMICGIGESQGTSWKHGNPVPHPFFARSETRSAAMVPIEEFAGGGAQDAIAAAGANQEQTQTTPQP